MDLSAPSYQKSRDIYNKLKRDVDKLDEFKKQEWNNKSIRSNDYSSKRLEIAIPDMEITVEQRKGLEMIKEYTRNKGIETTIIVVK